MFLESFFLWVSFPSPWRIEDHAAYAENHIPSVKDARCNKNKHLWPKEIQNSAIIVLTLGFLSGKFFILMSSPCKHSRHLKPSEWSVVCKLREHFKKYPRFFVCNRSIQLTFVCTINPIQFSANKTEYIWSWTSKSVLHASMLQTLTFRSKHRMTSKYKWRSK